MTLPRSTRWWPDDALRELERRNGDEDATRAWWRREGWSSPLAAP